jgi:two-component system, chemotaxis family, protein-glutamate methylesterase/glutaminase
MIRVLIADDSATARQLLRELLEQDADLRVIAEARNGAEAVRLVDEHRPDLVVMDVHMPVADGLAATKEIMIRVPTPILIVSAVRRRDVDLSLSATQAGALMALPKPGSPGSPGFPEAAAELRSLARAMANVKVVRRWSTSPPGQAAPPTLLSGRTPEQPAELVAIAASTGGPAALRRILMDLPGSYPAPILVVQHIARDFTAGFADWLGGCCALNVKLAVEGEPLRAGVVYVAPDDAHLTVSPDRRVRLSTAPPLGRFRPSATCLFESAGRVFGPRMVAVVLTGMGTDGAAGLEAARAAGAYVIVQDEASSVVYGMAQEAVRRGVADAIVALEQIGGRLVQLTTREAHVE